MDADQEFSNLFGINRNAIQRTCVLVPYLTRGMLAQWRIKDWTRGCRYAAGQHERFTLILAQIGPGFVGDAVLYLKDTPCRNLIFLGSCGTVSNAPGLSVGQLVIPKSAIALESFTHLLLRKFRNPSLTRPDPHLVRKFLKKFPNEVKLTRGVSFASLYLEASHQTYFIRNYIDIVDMECAAFFSAARRIRKSALALLYISDHVGSPDLILPKSPQQQTFQSNVIRKALSLIENFCTLI